MPKTNVEFWARKFELNVERDARKTRELEDAGWAVRTVWECQLRCEPDEVVATIREQLGSLSR